MKKTSVKKWGRDLRHHLFTLIGLIGCIAPWATPRHFPLHTLPQQTVMLQRSPTSLMEAGEVSREIQIEPSTQLAKGSKTKNSADCTVNNARN